MWTICGSEWGLLLQVDLGLVVGIGSCRRGDWACGVPLALRGTLQSQKSFGYCLRFP